MLEISIVAPGSRGDVQPYVALGKGLQEAGYRVRLLSSDDFAGLVSEAGLPFDSMGESVEALLQSEEWRATTESGNFLTILSRMRAEMKQRAAESARRLPALLDGSDLIVTGMAGITGVLSVAEALEIPLIQAYLFPFTPTRAFPSPLVPRLPLGGALNRLSFHATRQIFWQSFKVADVATREALALGKGSFRGPYRALDRKRAPILYGYSPHALPRPRDWGDHIHVTGYWFLDEPPGWSPPADLVAFLERGEPPLYIGFGSMGTRDPEAAGRIALEALDQSGQRGVLATGWGGLRASALPETVHLISSAPHSWLFERMAAVVHHGGVGTTAAGLRAGVPSVIVPFMGDQPFWGQRVAKLGVGPPPIRRKELTAKRLAEAITTAVSDAGMRERASALGRKIRAEDGVGAAVALIERLGARHGATIPH